MGKETENNFDLKKDFIKWFSELDKNSGNVAGGKGANLSEIYNLKIPVPPGFVVTAQAYDYFIEKTGIKKNIQTLIKEVNCEDTQKLDEISKKIREIIINSEIPSEMQEEILEAYENLNVKKDNIQKGTALDILNSSSEPLFVAVRSSATTEDLAEASFAGQQDTYLNIKGNSSLLEHIKKCFASLFTSRAIFYRNKKGFTLEQSSLAVVVQKMIDSDKSGVMFSKNPTGENENIIIEAVWGLGEGIVSGKITPDNYIVSKELKLIDTKKSEKEIAIRRSSGGNKTEIKLSPQLSNAQVLTEYEIKRLSNFALQLEEHYKKPQDIEFAIEKEEIYIVQTRPITTIKKDFLIDTSEKIKEQPILKGIAASPGIAVGKIKIINNSSELHEVKEGMILVTKMTTPDMVVAMQRSSGIITDEGGLTAHAAIVSREMGIPCIVGTKEATIKLKEDEIITMNSFNGNIYKGKVIEPLKKEISPIKNYTKTKIKVIVDLPSFAERAAKTGIKQVGLTRIEGIIAESGKHQKQYRRLRRDNL